MIAKDPEKVLPSKPNVWGEDVGQGFIARWLPGAFGEDVESIADVYGYRVLDAKWENGDPVRRTIKRAEILQTMEEAERAS